LSINFHLGLVTSTYCVRCMRTTCLENLEMSGNFTAIREMSENLLKNQGNVGEKSCQEKVA